MGICVIDDVWTEYTKRAIANRPYNTFFHHWQWP